MSSIKLLSDKMQERIADFGWYELTDIQEKTIPLVLNSNKNLIIESETASGKTEAVFLPILSIIENDSDYKDKVKVLYISPLKALINDQFKRIYKLSEEMNVRITKWHGDVNSNIKENFLNSPSGILQITPESIEAFMINRPEKIEEVFSGVEFIVIDEIHSFIGKDRGYHLQSLLFRLNKYFNKKPRVFGLSATIDGIDSIKKWICSDTENVELVSSNLSSKKTYYNIMHYDKLENSEDNINPLIIKDILKLTMNNKALIFCNSREKVESLTYNLNKELGYKKFYAHHSYIDKSLREEIESLVKEDDSVCIISTSTLELGIDIGSVDLVIQLDCTFSVSSLKQRIGRTGRRKNQDRISQIYTEEPESLLLSATTVELMKQGRVEKPTITFKNYDYLFQQILSIIVEYNGIRVENLIPELNSNPVFSSIDNHSLIFLLKDMIKNNYISSLDSSSELVLGYEGEKIVHNKKFYAMFESEEPYEIIYETKKIGLYDEYKNVNQIVVLSGRSWIVVSTAHENRKIYVEPFDKYVLPRFEPSIAERSELVRNELFNFLNNKIIPNYINENGINIIKKYEEPYAQLNLKENQRVIIKSPKDNCCQLFIDDKKLRCIDLYLIANNDNRCVCDYTLGQLFYAKTFNIDDLKNIKYSDIIDKKIDEIIDKNNFSKYFSYLPKAFKKEIYLERFCDFDGLSKFMNSIELINK
jgi:ATP-dependent Lhr-like helicase